MKKFTFNDIKEFCKTNYWEYLGEKGVVIKFSFIYHGHRKITTFMDLVVGKDNELSGTWQYLGCGMFGENMYMFNFKRIA